MPAYPYYVMLLWQDVEAALLHVRQTAAGGYHSTIEGNSPVIQFALLSDAAELAARFRAARLRSR